MPDPSPEPLRHAPGGKSASVGRGTTEAIRNLWVLGYGSIVAKQTCARTLGYEPAYGTEFRPASLAGAVRSWDACMSNIHDDPTDKYYIDGEGNRPDYGICFLGLADRSAASVNGVIVKVSPEGLAAFDRREKRYERVEVTDRIHTEHPIGDNDIVYAYYPSATARARFERHHGEGSAVVPTQYLSSVERAFASLGGGALDEFWASTAPPPSPADLSVVRGRDAAS